MMTMIFSVSAASLDDKIAYMDNVKELVLLTQKMRGNTNVYIKGGYVTQSIITDDREEVADSLRNLHRQFKTVGFKVDDEFAKLNLYMQNLNEVVAELDSVTTFQAYSLLIREMLKLGGEVQEDFFKDEPEINRRISGVMMNSILPLTERLGKLRGLGAGSAVCSSCEDDELNYLNEYIANVLDDLDAFVLEMDLLYRDYKMNYRDDLPARLKHFQQKVRNYVKLVDAKISEDKEVDIDAYDFFANGSSLIERTIEFYDINSAILK